jgi:hypothetical protein
MAPLLHTAREVLFVDKYFKFDDARYKERCLNCGVQRRLWYAFRVCFAKIEIALKALIEDRP